MSNMRKTTRKEIALLVSDIHLSHNPPICSGLSREEWYDAMKKSLSRLKCMARGLPIICAGDVFDKWNSPPELVNFAIDHLPMMYSIPGQHDLPNHRMDNIYRSAYKTLELMGRLIRIKKKGTAIGDKIIAYGFPWGAEISPPKRKGDGWIHLAVIHKYIFVRGESYPGADQKFQLRNWRKANELVGYDCVHLEDTHTPFCTKDTVNPGSLFIRSIDYPGEYSTKVGFLYEDGTVRLKGFPSEYEKVTITKAISSLAENEEFIALVKEVDKRNRGFSFLELLKKRIEENPNSRVTSVLMEAMEDYESE